MTKLVIIKWHSGNKVSSETTWVQLILPNMSFFFLF